MFNKNSFVLLACFFGSISCYIRDKGVCPPSTVLNSTELLKVYGKWYEVARVESEQEEGLQCVTFDIDSKASYQTGHPVTQTGLDSENLEYVYIANLVFLEDQTVFEYGEFTPNTPYPFGLTVIDTDLENYAVLLACTQVPDLSAIKPFGFNMMDFQLIRIRVAWILSRTPQMDVELQNKLVAKLSANGIDQSYLVYNKAGCPSNY